MITITIERAILDRLIEAWDSTVLPTHRDGMMQERMEDLRAELAKPDRPIKDSWHFERLDRLLSLCLSEPAYSDYLDSLKRVAGFSAELAKPSAPAWHDEPTEPGIWLCDEGGPDCYTYTAHNIVLLNDPALKDDECRWYGPIPQDTKAEGESA